MRYCGKKYQGCKAILFRFVLACCLMGTGIFGFGQQDDLDSLGTTFVDSLSQIDTAVGDEDTVEEVTYNYYYNVSDWDRDSFRLREVPDSVIQALKAEDDFWYADRDFKKPETNVPRKNNFWYWLATQKWYRVLAWIIVIGGFVAVLIWYLASSNVRLFRKKAKIVAVADDQVTDNIFEIDFQLEINKAMREGNYRLAIRLYFLRLLKDLDERKIIGYKQDRTNFDYLIQLANSHYYKAFFKVTRHYEYAWYGGFDVNEDLFGAIKKDFESLDAQLQKV